MRVPAAVLVELHPGGAMPPSTRSELATGDASKVHELPGWRHVRLQPLRRSCRVTRWRDSPRVYG